MNKLQVLLNEKDGSMKKVDWFLLLLIGGIYAILSFYKLGDFKAPNTFLEGKKEETIEIKSNASKISKIMFFNGVEKSKIRVYSAKEDKEWNFITIYECKKPFSWNEIIIEDQVSYIKFLFLKNSSLGEMAIFSEDEIIPIEEVNYQGKSIEILTDEKKTIPKKISYQNSTYFDEIYFATSAYQLVHHQKRVEWTHPPLGKVIQSIPIWITNKMTPFHYRLMGNIAGILIVVIMYFYGKILFPERKYAVISMLLMALDTFHFAQSRIGTIDTHLVLMMMLSILWMLYYVKNHKMICLYMSGLFFSFAISIKWTGFYTILPLLIMVCYDMIKNKKNGIKMVGNTILVFLVVPITIYSSIYLIFSNNYYKTNTISNIIKEQKEMFEYHSKLKEDHFFSSKWYTWPISYKPVWLHQQDVSKTKEETISGVGNIIIWIMGVLGMILLGIESIVLRNNKSIFLLLCILSFWLPYFFIPRIMFLYHFFPVLPFYFLGVVNLLKWISNKWKWIIPIYLSLVFLFFILYYPVVSGREIPKKNADKLELFDTWYF